MSFYLLILSENFCKKAVFERLENLLFEIKKKRNQNNSPQTPSIIAITPMRVWKLPSTFTAFAKSFPTAGIFGNRPIARINPDAIATIPCNPKYRIPITMAKTPIIVWNPPSHLATLSRSFPIAGMFGRMPIASISPATIFVSSTIIVFTSCFFVVLLNL